jgi:hypothetical protein
MKLAKARAAPNSSLRRSFPLDCLRREKEGKKKKRKRSKMRKG